MFDTRQTLIAEQMALGSHTGPRVCVCQRLDCMAAKGKQSYPRLKVIQKKTQLLYDTSRQSHISLWPSDTRTEYATLSVSVGVCECE